MSFSREKNLKLIIKMSIILNFLREESRTPPLPETIALAKKVFLGMASNDFYFKLSYFNL